MDNLSMLIFLLLIVCYYFCLLVINIVCYELDNKMIFVIVFICVFMVLVCFCVIVVNVMVFFGVLRKLELWNVYNILILFFVILDLVIGLVMYFFLEVCLGIFGVIVVIFFILCILLIVFVYCKVYCLIWWICVLIGYELIM